MTFPEVSLVLPPDPRSVGRARHFVRDVLAEWGFAGACDDAELGTSELVSNSVVHAHTSVRLTIRGEDARGVLVDVHDLMPDLECGDVSTPVPSTATGGRGLRIVEAISERWGVEQHENGKSVWFRLSVPEADVHVGVPIGAGAKVPS